MAFIEGRSSRANSRTALLHPTNGNKCVPIPLVGSAVSMLQVFQSFASMEVVRKYTLKIVVKEEGND